MNKLVSKSLTEHLILYVSGKILRQFLFGKSVVNFIKVI